MKKLVIWIPPIIIVGMIFYFSSMQNTDIPQLGFSDKFLHLVVYSLLSFFICRAVMCQYTFDTTKAVFISLFTTGLYGLFDEIHQMFTPTRSPSVGDLLADFAGGLLGAVIYGAFRVYFKKS